MTPMILLKLLGVWQWLKQALWGILSLARRYPWQAALVISLVWGWNGHHNASKWHNAYNAQKAAYDAAQDAASARQRARDAADLNKQTDRNRKLTDEHGALETARVDAVRRYAGLHKITECPSSGTNLASLPIDPGPSAKGLAQSGMVAITAKDLDELSAKAMRDTEWQHFGETMIAEGRAIRASEAESHTAI